MKKYKTSDGYHVYQILRDKTFQFMADKKNYTEDIKKLMNNIEDIKYDSIIFLFGIDTGCYLDELKKQICIQNKVFILEPNLEIFQKSCEMADDQIHILLFDKELVKMLFKKAVTVLNFNNIYFHAFGNYQDVYKEEYDYMIEQLDCAYYDASASINLANRFKKDFLKNLICNLSVIKNAAPVQQYFLTQKEIPAIVVSAGPSLDRNIIEMKKNKDKLKGTFIITGSRTAAALVENGMKPDMIVSIDPVEANYDMMKNYLDLDIPLAFYEYSNRCLLQEYQGYKIFIPTVLQRLSESCRNMKSVYFGGSVAHTCIDIAVKLGCNPIILIGQDLAFTNNLHHAQRAIYEYDKQLDYRADITVKNVFGKEVPTNVSLEHFRRALERYIAFINKDGTKEFINCSYGAAINGAPHEELETVLERDIYRKEKSQPVIKGKVDLNEKEIIDSMLFHVDTNHKKAQQALTLCELIIEENQKKSLLDLTSDDPDLQRMLNILAAANEFRISGSSSYLGEYFNQFIYDSKTNLFSMYAKDYRRLSPDLQYQAKVFKEYFSMMAAMLEEVKNLVLETLKECRKERIL